MAERAEQPAYARIVEEVREWITKANLPIGSPLPSIRELCDDYGATVNVARRVLTELQAQGVAEVRPGSGSFLAAYPAPGNRSTSPDYQEIMRRFERLEQTAQDLVERVAELERQARRRAR
jgi:GntR family transcriptional regulator